MKDGDGFGRSLKTKWQPKSDDIFKCIFLNENIWTLTKISLKFVPKGPINNIPALVQILAWHRPGDKSLSEPMIYWHIYASLGLNELTVYYDIILVCDFASASELTCKQLEMLLKHQAISIHSANTKYELHWTSFIQKYYI